jgi:hypothetical protein
MLHRGQAGRLCISIIGWGAESTEAQACRPDHLGLLTLHRSCDPKHFLTLFGGFLEHLSTVSSKECVHPAVRSELARCNGLPSDRVRLCSLHQRRECAQCIDIEVFVKIQAEEIGSSTKRHRLLE